MTTERSEEAGAREPEAGPTDKRDSKQGYFSKTIWIAAGLAIGFFLLWVVLGLVPWLCLREPGEYGDAFGAVSALFSGLVLAGVVVVLILQTGQLRYQREELEYQREEMRESQRAWEETAQAQRDAHAALKDQADSLVLAAYLQAVVALIQSPWKSKPEKSQAYHRVEGMIEALEAKVDGIIGKKLDARAQAEAIADSLEQAVRDFRAVLQVDALIAGDAQPLAAVQPALSTLKDDLQTICLEAEDSAYLQLAISSVEKLLQKSVPTGGESQEEQSRLARYGTAIIQMCSEVERAAQDYRKQETRKAGWPVS